MADQSFLNLSEKNAIKVALVGNPNSGKSTLFNSLTGLNQRTGNFAGVTVDKKVGVAKLNDTTSAEIIDLPGTYSLYPKSLDERVAYDVLCNPTNEDYPDVAVVVIDASNLKRNLFLVTQIIDLKIPVVLVLNMIDLVEKEGDIIDTIRLSERLGVKVVQVNARKGLGVNAVKKALLGTLPIPQFDFIDIQKLAPDAIAKLKVLLQLKSDFDAFQVFNNFFKIKKVSKDDALNREAEKLIQGAGAKISDLQTQETVERYKRIAVIVEECVTRKSAIRTESFTQKLDSLLTHKVWGYVIFLTVLFFIFQTLFYIAAYPTEWIEALFVLLTDITKNSLPEGSLTDLLVNGVLAGLGGIVVFVPQIALLFSFIAILEDTGYMARVSFIMDKLMRRFGLNGRSVIPLISGVACAIPAVMSARTISNWKERIITIMATPLMSCSARLPVYTLLISLVAPKATGFFNYQGLLLMCLYLIGFVAAMGAAWSMKVILKSTEKSYFIMELPVYRAPQWKTIGLTIYEKVKVFLLDAGKIILAVSVILWFLSTHAPGNTFEQIENKYTVGTQVQEELASSKMAAEKLEASYAGIMGKAIEPVIAPLGFDWKIGIALVTSFAAREVFVGTMATIYSVGDEDNTRSIGDKMRSEVNPSTGLPTFSLATGFSLLLFYAFAMQCMSTLAVVYRETKNWRWPVIQFLYMGALAYLSSLLVYQTMA